MISLDSSNLKGFVEQKNLENILLQIKKAHEDLEKKTGKGNAYLGWADLPGRIKDSFLQELAALAKSVQKNSDCLISIGIGGAYFGIRATLEYLHLEAKLPVYYVGNNMDPDYLVNLLNSVKNKRITIVVISKSGTTTEPALGFRSVKQLLSKKYKAAELKKRIICVTDEKKGALRKIADKHGYKSFVIPDDVGGRFSILTPVGLVPLALAGVDIKSLVEGARQGQKEYSQMDLSKNIAYQYAAIRYLLHKQGKKIDVLASFTDNLASVGEWWKQLFGESEGKEGKGIFPASLNLTADLHSMGQLMQQGERNIFETFLMVDEPKNKIKIPADKDNLDGFNFVAGKDLDFVNKQAYKATAMAHFEGGVPNMTLTICQADCFHLGQLYYFFERAAAISGYLLGVNPFDQPGVEAYKSKMFQLLGKK